MKTLSLDLETYSSADLNKTGVYRYAESPDFCILLFGYSVDGGDVKVVDIASGETVPEAILSALMDDTVEKWAFNSSFERVCLSRFIGLPTSEYLDSTSWKCSMVWSAYMGLPLSLEGSGAVLGLEKQKLSEGKDLIRFFCRPCKPTEANGQRTRNLPTDAPDKWLTFKAYNKRDVETELAIQAKLAKFPVPDEVWDEYHIDQEINDRGISVDMTMVREAIAIDSQSRERLMALMREMTELDNPNSVQQMKQWLSDNGLETDTLGKKAVKELLKTAPAPLGEVLSPPAATREKQRKEVSGNGKCRLRGRSLPWDVPVLRSQSDRSVCGAACAATKPASEPLARFGGSPRSGTQWRLRRAGYALRLRAGGTVGAYSYRIRAKLW